MYRVLNWVDRKVAKSLGKGYGTSTVSKETKLLKKFLKYPKLGVDIGGNIGEYSANLRKVFPKMEIHIFEPASVNFNKLNVRFAHDPNIFINHTALGDTSGVADLFSDTPGSGLGSMTKRNLDHFNIPFEVKESISVLRFEEYWKKILLMREIDIAKLDVEGHELAVLNGFGESIKKIRLVQFEFGGCNIDTRTFFRDFWLFFNEHSFDIYRITPFGLERIDKYLESHETFLTTNYLCSNRNMLPSSVGK